MHQWRDIMCNPKLLLGVAIAGLVLLPVSVFAADDKATLYPEGTIDKQALEKILPDKPPYSP